MMIVSKLSRAVAERAVIENLDELDYLLKQQTNEVAGLREALINYITVTEHIIEELGAENDR